MSREPRNARRQAGQRAGLSREAVLDAARLIADRDGLDRLTMRRLADELGVMPNALYSYVPDKEALLDALLDSLLGEIDMPDPAAVDWREGLTALMDDSRRLLLEHPQLVPIFLSRGRPSAPMRRGSARSPSGCCGRAAWRERAVEGFRALLIYTLGFAAIQVRGSSPMPRAWNARRRSSERSRATTSPRCGWSPSTYRSGRRIGTSERACVGSSMG